MRNWISFVLLASLAAGCNGGPKNTKQTASAVGDLTNTVKLARGTQSGMRGEGYYVARTEEEWQNLWKEHTSTQLPRPPAPNVGWATQMVVGVVIGARPSAGYTVDIASVERQAGKLVVRVVETKPDPKNPQATVVTRPFCFLAIPRTDDRVEFQLK